MATLLWQRSGRANDAIWPASNRAARKLIGTIPVPVIAFSAAAGADLGVIFPLGIVRGFQTGVGTLTAEALVHTSATAGNYTLRANFGAVKVDEDMSAGPAFDSDNVNFTQTTVPGVAHKLQRVTVTVPEASLDSLADGDMLYALLKLIDASSSLASDLNLHEFAIRQEL